MLSKYGAAATCLACAAALMFSGIASAAEPVAFGNNLAVPVIFAEGYGVGGVPVDVAGGHGLRGEPNAWSFTLPYTHSDGATYYLQQTENWWQAGWETGASWGTGVQPVDVTVDWSDNLRSKTWRTNSVIRIEHALTAQGNGFLDAFNMAYMYGTGQSEMWGTDGTTTKTTDRHVYTVCARLTIQAIDGPGGEAIGEPIYDSAAYERFGVDGKTDDYAAEINVSGKLIYGHIQHGVPAEGWYRITYALDPTAAYQLVDEAGMPLYTVETPCKVRLVALDASEAGSAVTLASDGMGTSLDLFIAGASTGGGGKGSGARR